MTARPQQTGFLEVLTRRNLPVWQRLGACREHSDPGLWFPGTGEKAREVEAKRICRGCPVREPCLEWGLSQFAGVWGGHTEKERHQLHRRQVSVTGYQSPAELEPPSKPHTDGAD